jgi:hypothetical protein
LGVNITEFEPPLVYSNPNLPEKVIEDINNALNMGWRVIVPEAKGVFGKKASISSLELLRIQRHILERVIH